MAIFEAHPATSKWAAAHIDISIIGAEALSKTLKVSYDEVCVSFDRLRALGCIKFQFYDEGERYAQAAFLADGLRTALMPDRYAPQNIEPSEVKRRNV